MQELNQALEPDPLAVWVEVEKKKIDLQHINPSLCCVTLIEVFTLRLPVISTAHVSTDWIYYPNGVEFAVLDK